MVQKASKNGVLSMRSFYYNALEVGGEVNFSSKMIRGSF